MRDGFQPRLYLTVQTVEDVGLPSRIVEDVEDDPTLLLGMYPQFLRDRGALLQVDSKPSPRLWQLCKVHPKIWSFTFLHDVLCESRPGWYLLSPGH